MTTCKTLTVLSLAGLFWAISSSPVAHADTWNKKTEVTFNTPVELPGGVVLQPGDYVMKLADSASSRHIVQVFNADQDRLYATILAIPNYRMEPAGKTVITFYESAAGQPQYLQAWFYPGDNFGQEFAYPKQKAAYLARTSGTNVPVAPSTEQGEISSVMTPEETQVPIDRGTRAEDTGTTAEPESATAPVQPETTPIEQPARSENTQVAQAQPPAQNQYETGTQATRKSDMEELPQTASNLPLLGLIGLLSLGAGFGIRFLAAGRRA